MTDDSYQWNDYYGITFHGNRDNHGNDDQISMMIDHYSFLIDEPYYCMVNTTYDIWATSEESERGSTPQLEGLFL